MGDPLYLLRSKTERVSPLARKEKWWDIPSVISTVEKKGRTIVPMEIRKKLGIEPGSALEWTMNQSGVSVVKLERPKSRGQGSILEALKLLGKMPVAERNHENVSTPEIDS